MNIGRKTPIKAVGYFDRCTDGNVQLHKRMYRIQCHENGLSVNGYFVQVFTLPYTLIKSIDHLTRNEVGGMAAMGTPVLSANHLFKAIDWQA